MLKLDVFLLHDVLPLAKAAVLKRRQITVRAQMRFSIQESATSREARSATLTEFEVASMAIVENMNPAFEFLLVKCRLAEIWDVNLEAN